MALPKGKRLVCAMATWPGKMAWMGMPGRAIWLPREFLAPDMAKITEALKAGVEVPGAEVYEEKIISAR